MQIALLIVLSDFSVDGRTVPDLSQAARPLVGRFGLGIVIICHVSFLSVRRIESAYALLPASAAEIRSRVMNVFAAVSLCNATTTWYPFAARWQQ